VGKNRWRKVRAKPRSGVHELWNPTCYDGPQRPCQAHRISGYRWVTALGQRERAAMPLFLALASHHPPWQVGCAGGVDRVAERGARETTTGG
jgi:hypothetical protein